VLAGQHHPPDGDLEVAAPSPPRGGVGGHHARLDVDQRVLAHTKTIGGGESASVTFPTSILKKGGAYQYLCTFPGHNALMHGTFKFG